MSQNSDGVTTNPTGGLKTYEKYVEMLGFDSFFVIGYKHRSVVFC